jgi:Cu-processing system ATP-binding protein
MIEVTGLTKAFGRLRVLDDLDLRIAPGRVTGIVGPNAVGKTTFLKLVVGLIHADAGCILVDGRPVSEDGAYRDRIGYMPQISSFPERLSGRYCLELLKDLRGPGAAIDEELIERLGLADQLNKPLRTLSGGTRQKVNAVMAFLFRPDLILLDEPTSGLDPLSSSILKDKIAAERARGRTIVVASHHMAELEEMADDVVVLLDGKVRFAGPVEQVKRGTHQPNLERAVAHLMIREVAA